MTTRIFQNAWFRRFSRKRKIDDAALVDAVTRAENDLIDADLGGGIIKQRIARKGQGRSGGYRTLIVYKRGDRAFFIYGFAKKNRDNITPDELAAFRKAAGELLSLSDIQIQALISQGSLTEVRQNGEPRR